MQWASTYPESGFHHAEYWGCSCHHH